MRSQMHRPRKCAASPAHKSAGILVTRQGGWPEKLKAVRIALLGCGTVGAGVVKLLRGNAALLERRLGAPLELAGVADRSLKPDRALGINASLITRDAEALVTRPDIDIVVELFGGREPARSLILKALEAGKMSSPPTRLCSPKMAPKSFARRPRPGVRSASKPASAAASRLSARCARRSPVIASGPSTASSMAPAIRS